MTDKETAEYLRRWIKDTHDLFAWPTDACGYDQHIKFVNHRNAHWHGERHQFKEFVAAYADLLEGVV